MENLGEWPFKRGPISKIGPSDGCGRDAVPLAVGRWYDFHEFGWHMGNVGSWSIRTTDRNIETIEQTVVTLQALNNPGL